MIELIEGTPGSGKSSFAIVRLAEALLAGKIVACNFHLSDKWSDSLAKYSLGFFQKNNKSLFLRRKKQFQKNAFLVGTGESLFSLSRDKSHSLSKEGSGLLILDEVQLLFNTRNWKKNFSFIEFFTQHRKLGWDILLVAHSIEMIDKQVRPLIEYRTTMRNLKYVRFLGIPLSFSNKFLWVTRYAGNSPGSGLRYKKGVATVHPHHSNLYDTLHVFAFDNHAKDYQYQIAPESSLWEKLKSQSVFEYY